MPPVASSQQRVYCALPGPILPRSLVSVALTWAAAPGPGPWPCPRWLTSKMPDGLADRLVLLERAGGVLQRHLPAPELGELGAECDVPVVQGRLLQRHGAEPTAADRAPSMPRRRAHRSVGRRRVREHVTTYTLRKGAADKTGADVVVVGVAQDREGHQVAAGRRGRRRGLRPQVQPAARRRSAFTGKAGEVAKVPTGGAIQSPLLLLVGLGDGGRPPSPYAAPPASPRARSATRPPSRSRCPPTPPSSSAR